MPGLIERAAADLKRAKYAIALTGAGISTESGVRDFRGPDGIWTKNPDMERRAYEAYGKLLKNPRKYWEENLNLPGILGDLSGVRPNAGHYALTSLEEPGILKCIITQNVDNLHHLAGSKNIIDYHGNAFKLRCMRCGTRYPTEEYDLRLLKDAGKLPPLCRKCNGVLKEDIVHFNEPIPIDAAEKSVEEAMKCDLMLVCGTSAVVYPFANLPRIARQKDYGRGFSELYTKDAGHPATIIEINAEPTPLTADGISDYIIQGKTGEILPAIVRAISG
jgi:NAD-dependent deacetylase